MSESTVNVSWKLLTDKTVDRLAAVSIEARKLESSSELVAVLVCSEIKETKSSRHGEMSDVIMV